MADKGPIPNLGGEHSVEGSSDKQPPADTIIPIAIVGMSCRFPGDASSVRGLWDMCCRGKSAWSEIPKDRMNGGNYWHPSTSKHGSFNVKGAHFLKEDVGLFDAPFFNISPNEANAMDPQQRLLLEVTYEALENAGIPLNKIMGQNVGVFVGGSMSDYQTLLNKDIENGPVYQATGTAMSFLANRISYIYDLKGPSVTTDTACSSGLTALHLACQSIRTGEICQALVGGVYILLSPENMIGMSMLGLFGTDGRSYSFDHRATGYGRGEGGGVIVLKSLEDAIRDGDNIHAIIRHTGMNQDGKTSGPTMPSLEAQETLIKSVYREAGLDPLDTYYVEAHGTGTAVGDPIEASAIARSLAKDRPGDKPLYVGSVKSNIGHLEAGSGLAGIIKASLVLQNGLIPPNPGFEKANEEILLESWKLKVPTSMTPWPPQAVRRASVSSFGFGGTNVHVILESDPGLDKSKVANERGLDANAKRNPNSATLLASGTLTQRVTDRSHLDESGWPNKFTTASIAGGLHQSVPSTRLFKFSAAHKKGVKLQMLVLTEYLRARSSANQDGNEPLLRDLAYTLSERRSSLEWRAAITASTVEELIESMDSFEGEPLGALKNPGIAFVFTGQGSQWPAMGRHLMRYPSFAAIMEKCEGCLRDLGAPWLLLDILQRDDQNGLINLANISQPATIAIQIALVSLLASWNINPVAVVGHSSGEIAAAYAVGALSLSSCMALAYHRGALASRLGGRGAMLAIGATVAQVASLLKKVTGGRAVIACINSPSLITVSGDIDAVESLQQLAVAGNILARRLKVDTAYHSHQMREIAADYLIKIGGVRPNLATESSPRFHSSLRGKQVPFEDLKGAYWCQNLTSPVLFSQAVNDMCLESNNDKSVSPIDVIIEIGPHSSLKAPIQEILKPRSGYTGSSIRYLPTLLQNSDAANSLLHTAGSLYCTGCPVQCLHINSSPQDKPYKFLADLPQYPWLHTKRYWHETRISKNNRFRLFPRHDLLGALAEDFNVLEPRWKSVIRLSEVPWLSHHLIQSSVVFPFAAYVSMACEAAFQRATMRDQKVGPSHSYKFRGVCVKKSLILTGSSEVELSLTLRPRADGSKSKSSIWDEFCVCSHIEETGWSEHCSGLVSVVQDKQTSNEIDGQREWRDGLQDYTRLVLAHEDACRIRLDCSKAYNFMSRTGMEYGSSFRNVVEAKTNAGSCAGTVVVPDTAALMPHHHETPFIVHPTMLDSCLHVAVLATCGGELSDISLRVPTYVKSLRISHRAGRAPGDRLRVFASAKASKTTNEMNATVTVFDCNGRSIEGRPDIEINEIMATKLPNKELANQQSSIRGLCYKTQWQPCLQALRPDQYQQLMSEEFEDGRIQTQSRNMERAAFYYTQNALATLSNSEVDGFHEHHRKLYRVLRKVSRLGTTTLLPSQMAEWLQADDVERSEFLESVKNADDCGRMMCTVGEQLPQIFRKEVDPLSIMFTQDMLERYYSSYLSLQKGYAICSRWVGQYLSHQNPAMNILEIGAGTGSTTLPLLQSLGTQDGLPPRFGHFLFTDVSAGFFERAKERLNTWGSWITYKTLDIEKNPVEQGFEEASFDLVVASNVLHVTANMDNTLRNARKLLKNGGRIIILEANTLALSQTILFGTIPGWWAGEETERQDGPTISEPQWDNLLRRTGFSGLDGSLSDNPGGDRGGSAMISTAISNQQPLLPCPTIIVDQHSDKALISELQSSFAQLTGQEVPVKAFPFLNASDLYCVYVPLDHPTWRHVTEERFNQLQQKISRAKVILWVTRGAAIQNPDAAMSTGVARVVRSENAGVDFVMLDLDGKFQSPNAHIIETITTLYRHRFQCKGVRTGVDSEYLERDGVLQIQRAVLNDESENFVLRETRGAVLQPQKFLQEERLLKLKLETPGRLDSLYFADDDSLQCDIGDDQVEVEVKATGLNFRDVMIGLAQVPYQELGSECSGVIKAIGKKVAHLRPGDRVCGLSAGTFGRRTRTLSLLVSKIPEEMSFTTAATIPVIFCTALYSLRTVARLQKGESILIHAAAGGVGQAAIMLSQLLGAEVFVTLGTVEKKDFVEDTYGIPESHIFSSRDTTFESGILRATDNRGVDVVLNSISGEALKASWRCIAPLGRFVDIGKSDLVQNSYLEMERFLSSATFAGVDLTVVAKYKPGTFNQLLTEVIELHRRKTIRLVSPITSFGMSEIQDAMRLMQGGKHIGKIIIQGHGDDIVQALPPLTRTRIAHQDASYLITGGTGGVGRSLARWLAKNGAKNIVLASRSGLSSASARAFVEDMATLDSSVTIAVRACDLGDRAQLEDLVQAMQGIMPPIKGVIHGAMILRDVLFEKSSFEDWTSVVRPRVEGAWNLHHCLPDLDYFVMLASLSGIVGTRGQAAYAATNTFLDSFTAFRRSHNLPASTIDIGAIQDVGYVAEAEHERQVIFSHLSHDQILEEELFAMVKDAIVHASSRDDREGQVMAGLKLVPDKPLPFWAADVRFSHSVRSIQSTGGGTTRDTGAWQVGKKLRQATTVEEANQIISQALVTKISKLSMTPADEIVPEKPLAAYGLDSLVAIEMRNWLIGELEVDVPLLQLMNSPSLTALAVFIRQKSSLIGKALREAILA